MKAIFFDRDDTLIKDSGYMHRPEQLEFFPETFTTLKTLQSRGFTFFIVTNQSGIGRGLFSTDEMNLFNQEMLKVLNQQGILIE